jgi:hypothetical protein
MRSFMTDQLKEEEMGRARSMCGVEDTCIPDNNNNNNNNKH